MDSLEKRGFSDTHATLVEFAAIAVMWATMDVTTNSPRDLDSEPQSALGPIPLKRLAPELPLPKRAHAGDAGADLYAAETVTLAPGQRALVGTGVALALPLGTVGLIHPRSGLAAKHGLSIVNTPGTIDAQYRGELKVCMVNTDRDEAFTIERGMRIAQLVVQRVELVDFVEVDELDDTERGAGGYGSTGTN